MGRGTLLLLRLGVGRTSRLITLRTEDDINFGACSPVTSIPMQIDQLRVSNGVESDGHGEANGQAQNDEMPIENDNDRIV